MALPGAYCLTYADWLEFPDDGRLYEIIEGELFVAPPPSIEHQRISRELGYRLMQYLRATGAGEVLSAPVGLRLHDQIIVEPDLLVVLAANAGRVGEQAVDGPADLVVEILSPGTAGRDLGAKRAAYEASGVSEYWVVDPERQRVEVLVLEGGAYVRHGLYRRLDDLSSHVLPDLSVALRGIFPAREA